MLALSSRDADPQLSYPCMSTLVRRCLAASTEGERASVERDAPALRAGLGCGEGEVCGATNGSRSSDRSLDPRTAGGPRRQ